MTYDLGQATVLPGLIDVHVHILAGATSDGPAELRAAATAEKWDDNVRATLMAGFTTIQSVGDPADKALRDAIAAGFIVGPRLLTSVDQIHPGNRSPDELRAEVRKLKAEGADLIKLYGSGSGFTNGKSNVSLAQMSAVCGEARLQGLRCVVHAQPAEAIINAVKAGATEIEHGGWGDDESIKAMADAQVLYDPTMSFAPTCCNTRRRKNCCVEGGSTRHRWPELTRSCRRSTAFFRRPSRLVYECPVEATFGFAHGENALELIVRVEAGRKADGRDHRRDVACGRKKSLGLGKTIGAIAAGYEADIIAVSENPLEDITVLRHVTFVMKGGQIYRHRVNAI